MRLTSTKLLMPILALSSSCVGATKGGGADRPNILFIMSDDHALAAISAYGEELSKYVQTPNIDRIADEGALLRANYCCNSISGPSRAAVMTGLHSHSNGFMRNGQTYNGDQEQIQKILRREGYQTALIGKWHLNTAPQGFDYWTILNDQGEYYNPDFITERDTTLHIGYTTDLITEKTIGWLEQRDRTKPFYMMMNHKACHRNWWPAERHYNLYDDVVFPMPSTLFDDYKGRTAAQTQKMNIYRDMYEGHDLKMNIERGSDSLRFDPWPHLYRRMTDEQRELFEKTYIAKNEKFWDLNITDERELAEWKYQRYMQEYMATVAALDESVGEVLKYLEERDLLDNTIIVYTSDQGFYLGEHGWFDKRFMYEQSMLMPCLIRYPEMIKAHTEVEKLTQNIDFAPTLLDMCGVESPEYMQGESFAPLLERKMVKGWRESLYYHFYEHPGFHNVQRHYGVKTERYKLMHFYMTDNWEFFDLKTDPDELHNIYDDPQNEKLIEELKGEIKRLQSLYEVPEELTKRPQPKKKVTK